MAVLNKKQIRVIEDAMAFPRGRGYVVDFSDNSFSEFFDDEFQIDIYHDKYSDRGASKRNHLVSFLLQEEPRRVAQALRALWDRREGIIARTGDPNGETGGHKMSEQFLKIIQEIEGATVAAKSDGIDRYTSNRTLDELISDITRDLQDNKPETAVDRLHTYCMGKITHLLATRKITCEKDEPLHSRFGKYRKALLREQELSSFSDRALKSSMSLLESLNDIRNNQSLAHDNEILDNHEARFVFDTMNAVLVFVRALEAGRYDD